MTLKNFVRGGLAALLLFIPVSLDSVAQRLSQNPVEPVKVVVPRFLALVKRINPDLPFVKARYLAKTIEEKAAKYRINPIVLASIVAQESRFQLNLKNCHPETETCDYGLGQVNTIWVKSRNLDPRRLQYDIAYNLDASAAILRHYKNSYPKDPKYHTRYYSGYPELRQEYEERLNKWIRLASR